MIIIAGWKILGEFRRGVWPCSCIYCYFNWVHGTRPSRPGSGSGQSTERGDSSGSLQTRWPGSTGTGSRLCRDRRSRERPENFQIFFPSRIFVISSGFFRRVARGPEWFRQPVQSRAARNFFLPGFPAVRSARRPWYPASLTGPDRSYGLMRFYRPPENPWKNSGTTGPTVSPVVPRFPHTRIFEGIIRKSAELGRNY
jgi:hypothetical protein